MMRTRIEYCRRNSKSAIGVSVAISLAVTLNYQNSAAGALVIESLGDAVTQNFDALGAGTNLAVLNGSDGWRHSNLTTFSTADSTLSQVQSATLTGSSSGGAYNFLHSPSDRAVGFLNSGSFSSPRSLMLQFTNDTEQPITELQLSFNYEKYRTGSRAFNMNFFHGSSGTAWTAATGGDHAYAADASNSGLSTPTSVAKSFNITGINIPSGSSYFLRWTLTGVGGSSNGQGIGLDNFSITGIGIVPEPGAFVFGSLISGVFGVVIAARKLYRGKGIKQPGEGISV